MSESNKLVLIDGNSIAYRAFFALPLLSTANGKYTNAVYGFTMMLLRLIQDEKPTHIIVAFDKGKKTFRHDTYAAYKGTREKTPSELSEQFQVIREVLDAFGICYVEIEGYEADDIIGTVTNYAESEKLKSIVVSGDKDLLQLVSDQVHTLLTRKGITEVDYYDPQAVQDRYGLNPLQIIDLKGLMGDSSDNIPGIPGVGEKTALKLLHEYGSVESVLDHADQVSGKKLQEKLHEFRDEALMSKKLATIYREVPIQVQFDELSYDGFDVDKVRTLFQKLEFRSLIDKLPASDKELETDFKDESKPIIDVTVLTADQWQELQTNTDEYTGIFLDLDDHYQTGKLSGIAIGTADQAFYYKCESNRIPTELATWVSNHPHKVFFDVKSAFVVLSHQDIVVPENADDLLLAAYLLNPSDGGPVLEEMIKRELGWQLGELTQGKKKILTDEMRQQLSGEKAVALVRMRDSVIEQLQNRSVLELYHDLELPLAFVLAKMEIAGVKVDRERLRQTQSEFAIKLVDLTSEIYRLAGTEFNINSPKQMGEILFEKMGLPAQKKTKTGYSTSADVLEKLAPYSDIVQKILEYRQLVKLQSTYVEGLLKVITPDSVRVHTCFNQATTATGRLSSTDPNLQNIPIRMEEGRKLRQAFIPSEKSWKILSADYSQIELRILAHISQDEALMDAFLQGMDIHTRTASDVFEVPIEQVTSDMRRAAKAVNFGIVYGISDYGLSQNLNITRKEAAEFIENYFKKFPGVKRFMEVVVDQARKDGYVTTLLHRRRDVPDIHASNFNLRSFAERTAMNTPIQGTAADIIKLAMVQIQKSMEEAGVQSRLLLQVHDELIFEVPEEELSRMTELVKNGMEHAITLSVPLLVDIHAGATWYEAK